MQNKTLTSRRKTIQHGQTLWVSLPAFWRHLYDVKKGRKIKVTWTPTEPDKLTLEVEDEK